MDIASAAVGLTVGFIAGLPILPLLAVLRLRRMVAGRSPAPALETESDIVAEPLHDLFPEQVNDMNDETPPEPTTTTAAPDFVPPPTPPAQPAYCGIPLCKLDAAGTAHTHSNEALAAAKRGKNG